MNRLAELWRRYRRWKADAENPSPIKRLDDIDVPPGHVALIFEEHGDPLDPKSRPGLGQPVKNDGDEGGADE